jgi:hypothetical protein
VKEIISRLFSKIVFKKRGEKQLSNSVELNENVS